jgi:hypothetical protein
MDPLKDAVTLLGEHFEHYLIVVAKEPHECEVEYNNSFAAKGLIDTASKIIDNHLDTGSITLSEALTFVWPAEDEDEDEGYEDDDDDESDD